MHAFNGTVSGSNGYSLAPDHSATFLDSNGTRSMGDDASGTVDNTQASPRQNPSAKISCSAPSALNHPLHPYLYSHASIDPPSLHASEFPFSASSQQQSMYSQQLQSIPPGSGSTISPLALQSMRSTQGASQSQQQAVGSQQMLMHVVPQMQSSYPYPQQFCAQMPQPNACGMPQMVQTMVPAHLVQSMIPLVNANDSSVQGVPMTGSTGAGASMHAGCVPLQGNFQQLDARENAPSDNQVGGHRGLQGSAGGTSTVGAGW
jgi:hypothetical protein